MLIPVDLNNPGTLSVSEIRVWSTPSLPVLQGSISNTYVDIIGQSESYNWQRYTRGFYVDLIS